MSNMMPTRPSALTGQETRTSYGTVTDRQVTFNYKKGVFQPVSREDIPIRHVTSVRVETRRHIFWGIIFGVSGVASLANVGNSPGLIIAAAIFLGIALLLFWGFPRVVLNTAGGDLRPSVGWPWTKGQADVFVNSLRAELFKAERG
jgi:hypothetical protein